MMRKSAYATVILVLFIILQTVQSRKLATRNKELKTNSENPVDKLDLSKFVDHLIKRAKTIKKQTRTGQRQNKPKKLQKIYEEDDESTNYDFLGHEHKHAKDFIVRSNTAGYMYNGPIKRLSADKSPVKVTADSKKVNDTAKAPGLSFDELALLFRASDDVVHHKKKGNSLRSGGGYPKLNDGGKEQDGKIFRSVDDYKVEKGSKLVYDLETFEDSDELASDLQYK